MPFGYYLVFVWLVTTDLISCPPDAYECPI